MLSMLLGVSKSNYLALSLELLQWNGHPLKSLVLTKSKEEMIGQGTKSKCCNSLESRNEKSDEGTSKAKLATQNLYARSMLDIYYGCRQSGYRLNQCLQPRINCQANNAITMEDEDQVKQHYEDETYNEDMNEEVNYRNSSESLVI